jgi:hypothetical protein
MGLKVFKDCCNQCLLTKNKIVTAKRVKEIVNMCKSKQTHFICHKTTGSHATICKNYFDKFGHYSQMVRIASRLDDLEFIEQQPQNKL